MYPIFKDLLELWRDVEAHEFSLPAIEFYGHTSGPYRAFSNFHEHAPYSFQLPEVCGRDDLVASGRSASTLITFAEKAIMLCKAAVMSDYASYDTIVRAQTPAQAKALGRKVGNWKQQLWSKVVCEVAREVVLQKFATVPGLEALLLGTGNHASESQRHSLKRAGPMPHHATPHHTTTRTQPTHPCTTHTQPHDSRASACVRGSWRDDELGSELGHGR